MYNCENCDRLIGNGVSTRHHFEVFPDHVCVEFQNRVGKIPLVRKVTAHSMIGTIYEVEGDEIKTELTKKKKEIKELQKDNEGLTRELEHEQTESDKSGRIIEWLSGLRGDFYKSDVEDDIDGENNNE